MGKNRKYILSPRAIKIGIEQDDREEKRDSQRVKANKNKYETKNKNNNKVKRIKQNQ